MKEKKGISQKFNKTQIMREYVKVEMSKNKYANPRELNRFIESLNNKQISYLCKFLSTFRNNGVYDFIDMHNKWEKEKVPLSKLKLRRINKKVEPFLRKDNFNLYRISKDKKIIKNSEFKSQGKIGDKKIIVVNIGNEYKIIDGNHRAIELVKYGDKKMEILKPIEKKPNHIKHFLSQIFYKIVR